MRHCRAATLTKGHAGVFVQGRLGFADLAQGHHVEHLFYAGVFQAAATVRVGPAVVG